MNWRGTIYAGGVIFVFLLAAGLIIAVAWPLPTALEKKAGELENLVQTDDWNSAQRALNELESLWSKLRSRAILRAAKSDVASFELALQKVAIQIRNPKLRSAALGTDVGLLRTLAGRL